MAHGEGGGSSGDLHASGGGSSGPAVTAAVSCFCTLIGLPCLSHCVHGASIGGGSDRHPSQAPDDEQPPAGQRGDQVGLLSSALPCRVMCVCRGVPWLSPRAGVDRCLACAWLLGPHACGIVYTTTQ
jgi:hypothetical protein